MAWLSGLLWGCLVVRKERVCVCFASLSVVVWSAEAVIGGSACCDRRLSYRVIRNFWGPCWCSYGVNRGGKKIVFVYIIVFNISF